MDGKLKEKAMSNIETRLPTNILTDIYIVYVEHKYQVRKLLNKMNKLGFVDTFGSLSKLKNHNCYYIAKQVHTNDSYNGNKFIQFGYKEDFKDEELFNKCLIDYNKFLKM